MIYMKLEGIEGNVTSKGHQHWIELDSISFHTQRALNTHSGRVANRETSLPQLSDFTVSKLMDKTSPLIFNEAVVGRAMPEVIIHLVTTNNMANPYMEYRLYNVIVRSYEVLSESASEDKNKAVRAIGYPMEVFCLNFDKIEMKFTPFDENHKPQSPIPSGYDLKEAIAA
jgi:type VI secretion system secreted protein Hcp